jgi:hypothetical protein
MKTQPELQAIPMSHDPCNADNREVSPALQSYAPCQAAADRRHDHILRAALLTSGCTIRDEAVETH